MELKKVSVSLSFPTYIPIEVPTYVPIQASQVPIRLAKLPISLNEECRKTEVSDYLAYIGADIGEKALDSWLKNEEEKPLEKRNFYAEIFGEILKVGCSFAKYEINRDLCNPIGNN